MTNLEFRNALKAGKKEVIFTDNSGREYIHTILKAGKKQVSLYNNFLEREYLLRFSVWREGVDFTEYKLKED